MNQRELLHTLRALACLPLSETPDANALRGQLQDEAKRLLYKSADRRHRAIKTTGRFKSREELESYIWRTYQTTPANQADIAKQCRVSVATVSNILALKPMPAIDAPVRYRGHPGQVHHAFRSAICRSGLLVSIYRHGPRQSYTGYVCSSQLEGL